MILKEKNDDIRISHGKHVGSIAKTYSAEMLQKISVLISVTC